jgi:hypothetical protein
MTTAGSTAKRFAQLGPFVIDLTSGEVKKNGELIHILSLNFCISMCVPRIAFRSSRWESLRETNRSDFLFASALSGKYRFTDTWVRGNGRWHVVASQYTKVLEAWPKN